MGRIESHHGASAAITRRRDPALQCLDTCIVSHAIETFDVRLRNTGFADSSIHCIFKDFPPMAGYAATARVRTEDPPVAGRMYRDRSDWWNSILQIPAPRIAVIEDTDKKPGVGAFLGDMHAAILMAVGCIGYVSEGAVRQLPRVRELGFHLFAGNVAVSHAYAHIFDFGAAIQVGGMLVHSGDLLHGGPAWTADDSGRDCKPGSGSRATRARKTAKGN
jgi:4-hydroxy-4-methyl-2-oxoglutarate aldolase